MDKALVLAASALAGVALGLVHFGGLWWTTRALLTTRRPVLLALGSQAARLAILLAGLLLISQGHWERLPAALLGILAARTLLVRRLGPPLAPAKEKSP